MKKVYIKTEYITLGQLLKFVGIVGNGGETKAFLAQNVVKINGEPDNRRGKKLFNGDVVTVLEFEFAVLAKNTVE